MREIEEADPPAVFRSVLPPGSGTPPRKTLRRPQGAPVDCFMYAKHAVTNRNAPGHDNAAGTFFRVSPGDL